MGSDNWSVARGQRASRFGRVVVGVLATLVMATSVAVADDAKEEKYDPLDAGHPLRVAAYILHPVGVILDRLLIRPAYWLGSHEPMKTLFGRTD